MDYEVLKDRDYVLVIDKSGSMTTKDTPNGKSRFQYIQESTQAIAHKLHEFDPDGITLIPFSGSFKIYENITPEKVADVFKENEPMGGTDLAPVLESVFKTFLADKSKGKAKPNGTICIVCTDGEPADKSAVRQSIINFSKKLDNGDGEFGLLFLQVGKDPGASAFLSELDDGLKDAKFDIVDCKTFDEIEKIPLLDVLAGALND